MHTLRSATTWRKPTVNSDPDLPGFGHVCEHEGLMERVGPADMQPGTPALTSLDRVQD
jgi:hypothetical protein